MSAILQHRSGSLQGHTTRIEREVTRLGRKSENDIVFSDHVVSGFHAEIRVRDGSWMLVDLDSTNGTFVNGERITKALLNDGDTIEIGEKGPQLEFRSGSRHGRAPRIVPLDGEWEERSPVELSRGTHTIGRSTQNEIVAGRRSGSIVSGRHAEIHVHTEYCELEDLDSSNGTFVNGERIRRVHLKDGDRVELGEGGPSFEFRWKGAREAAGGERSKDDPMFRKLERAARGGPAGDRTMMLLHLADRYHKRRRRPYLVISAIVFLVAVGALGGAYFLWQRLELEQTRGKFYESRSLAVEIVGRSNLTDEEKRGLRARQRKLEDEFERYLVKAGFYKNRSSREQAVMRLARRLGEADLDMPSGFFATVMEYVERWKSTPRLRRALDRARKQNLLKTIRYWLAENDLPNEFLFIALQESDFDKNRVGPKTRFGIAKGMWQFIPPTAMQYRLEVGSLKDETKLDEFDKRHDPIRSTMAAAEYLKDLYTTKAAASGLLVMASYNYGPTRITKNLDDLPNNPRARNFWNFYRNNWIPAETKDYVMYIFSAALVCEHPDLFGFDMEPISKEW
jgi:pSer/pThr/pTyr-binding forkhead associated (FHA) protein/soluble lytic murein transglycosylase-like protein